MTTATTALYLRERAQEELTIQSIVTAIRRVIRARQIVARQRERIARLEAEHWPTEDALHMLDIFIETLAALEHHQRLLCEEAEGRDRDPEWLFSRLAARIRTTAA